MSREQATTSSFVAKSGLLQYLRRTGLPRSAMMSLSVRTCLHNKTCTVLKMLDCDALLCWTLFTSGRYKTVHTASAEPSTSG